MLSAYCFILYIVVIPRSEVARMDVLLSYAGLLWVGSVGTIDFMFVHEEYLLATLLCTALCPAILAAHHLKQ